MLEVRRIEPGARGGAAPADRRGGVRTGVFRRKTLATARPRAGPLQHCGIAGADSRLHPPLCAGAVAAAPPAAQYLTESTVTLASGER